MDSERTLGYINTDLLLCAPFDLSAVAAALAPKHAAGASISCLHVGHNDEMGYQATFEAFGPDGNHGTPEESITVLLDAIERFPVTVQSLWRSCSRRTFDLGYRSGVTPHCVSHFLSLDTLARMQSLGIDVAITVYQMTE
jgi:hypothetical protein